MKRIIPTSILLLALAVSLAGAEAITEMVLEGKILDPSRPLATMQVGPEEVVLHLGPIWFWELNDLYLEADEELQVVGELITVEGVKHCYPMRLVLEEREIELATEDGIPHWARRGSKGTGHRGRAARGRDSGGDPGHRGGGQGGPAGRGNCWRN